jgi:hypothetical protein
MTAEVITMMSVLDADCDELHCRTEERDRAHDALLLERREGDSLLLLLHFIFPAWSDCQHEHLFCNAKH